MHYLRSPHDYRLSKCGATWSEAFRGVTVPNRPPAHRVEGRCLHAQAALVWRWRYCKTARRAIADPLNYDCQASRSKLWCGLKCGLVIAIGTFLLSRPDAGQHERWRFLHVAACGVVKLCSHSCVLGAVCEALSIVLNGKSTHVSDMNVRQLSDGHR